MLVSDIRPRLNLKPLKLSVGETPHLTLETNLTCNIRCRGCYNLYRGYVKPLAQIKREIDLALAKRNLDTITILGGEPTLHPDLAEIIVTIKKKGLICEMLTNGMVFLKRGGEILLDRIVEAGLDRIILHVDAGQSHIHRDIDAVRHTLFARFERKKLYFSLSTTIYPENQGEIPTLMKRYAGYRYFDGILSILEISPGDLCSRDKPRQSHRLLGEYESIARELGVAPAAYLPSSLDDAFISWLMYFYYINTRTRRCLSISPEYNRLFRRLYRRLVGRHVFGMTCRPWLFPINFLLTCLIEVALHPARIVPVIRILRESRWMRELRFHYILIQNGPEPDAGGEGIHFCFHCPDATIRNGRLTPVCVADLIAPLDYAGVKRPVSSALRRMVYRHLGEA